MGMIRNYCNKVIYLEKGNLIDMGEPKDDSFIFVRLDKKKDFTPENCQWMSKTEGNKLAANYGEQIRKQKHKD